MIALLLISLLLVNGGDGKLSEWFQAAGDVLTRVGNWLEGLGLKRQVSGDIDGNVDLAAALDKACPGFNVGSAAGVDMSSLVVLAFQHADADGDGELNAQESNRFIALIEVFDYCKKALGNPQ